MTDNDEPMFNNYSSPDVPSICPAFKIGEKITISCKPCPRHLRCYVGIIPYIETDEDRANLVYSKRPIEEQKYINEEQRDEAAVNSLFKRTREKKVNFDSPNEITEELKAREGDRKIAIAQVCTTANTRQENAADLMAKINEDIESGTHIQEERNAQKKNRKSNGGILRRIREWIS